MWKYITTSTCCPPTATKPWWHEYAATDPALRPVTVTEAPRTSRGSPHQSTGRKNKNDKQLLYLSRSYNVVLTYISIVESVRSICRLRYTFSWYHRSTNYNFDYKCIWRSLWTWSCCLPEWPYHFQCLSAVHSLRLYIMRKIIKYHCWDSG